MRRRSCMSGSRSCSSSSTTVPSRGARRDASHAEAPRIARIRCPHVRCRGRTRPLRRGAARLLRGSRGPGRGGAVPAAGHRRPRHPRRPARGRRRALLRPRRPEPDQRPQPRPAGAPAGRARPARHRHAPACGATATAAPFFADALHEALDLGADRVVTVLTSAYSSYSSCRQYREDLAAAVDAVGPAADGPRRRQGAALRRAPRRGSVLAARAGRVGARAARPGIRAPPAS